MKLTIFALLLLALLSSAFAQPPDTLWTRNCARLPGSRSGANSVYALPDGGFLVGGFCCEDLFHTFFTSAYVGRYNVQGYEVWNWHYWGYPDNTGFGTGASVFHVQPLPDGGCIVAAGAGEGPGYLGPTLIRLLDGGDSLWWRQFNGTTWHADTMRAVCVTARGDIVGIAKDSTRVTCTDALGNFRWQTSLHPADLRAIVATPDSGCVVAGSDDQVSRYAFYLAKLNASGDTVWTWRYPVFFGGSALAMSGTPSGGFLLVGTALMPDAPLSEYAAAIAVDADGHFLWPRVYVDFQRQWNVPPIVALDRCREGGYILLADRLLRINESGDTLWTRALPDPQVDYRSVCQTADSGYVVAGSSIYSCHIAKFSREGLPVSPFPSVLPSEFRMSAFPNPFNPSTTISFTLPREARTRIAVFDILGREVTVLADKMFTSGDHRILFNGSSLPTGLYFARLQSGSQVMTQKLLLLK